MKKIAVVTDFLDFNMQYGLTPAVINQLNMLQSYNYKPDLFVVEGTENEESVKLVPDGVTIKPFIPFMHLYDYQQGTKEQKHNVSPIGEHGEPSKTNFKKQVKLTEELIEPELQRYDIVIEHDILYQTWKLPYNQALRNIGERHPNIKWLHWCHSAPSQRPDRLEYPHTLRFTPMNNSLWVTMNDAMRSGFAKQYNVSIDKVKTVYHVVDASQYYDFHPLTEKLYKTYRLWEPELLLVFISRFDHAKAKGVYDVAEFTRQLKYLCEVKLIYVNSWSHTEEAKKVVQKIKEIIPDAVFTSELGKKYETGVPHKVVKDLLNISSLFINPSQSETFSFTTVEAAMSKNLLVVNLDLKPLTEIMPHNTAFHIGFGCNWGGTKITRNYQPSKEAYLYDQAKLVYGEYMETKPLQAQRRVLQTFSIEAVWETQLKPLIEG